MQLHRSIMAVAAGLCLAAPAVALAADHPPAKPPRACFLNQNIDSWSAPDRRTVYLKVLLHDYYEIKLLGDCADIDFNEHIGLESRGSDWICSDLDVTIIAPTPIGPQRCAARSLRKLTPAEVAALPPKDKP